MILSAGFLELILELIWSVQNERNDREEPNATHRFHYNDYCYMGDGMSLLKKMLEKRRARISDKPHPMQELIDADNKQFPAAYELPREYYNKLSEVPQRARGN